MPYWLYFAVFLACVAMVLVCTGSDAADEEWWHDWQSHEWWVRRTPQGKCISFEKDSSFAFCIWSDEWEYVALWTWPIDDHGYWDQEDDHYM